ncbi:MAG: HindIII family type II restriction endonuclease [Treponema sp.]|nr:HindIII family type II restriction endonuclease [Treponema sp.]
MTNENPYLKNYIANVVFNEFKSSRSIDTDSAVLRFKKSIAELNDEEICEILIHAGYIPDLYEPDGSPETLFSKLNEVLVAFWAEKMGFSATPVKTKGSYEDVTIKIDGRTIVCDAKTFRLGRSQAAPNVKDFLKLEDINKWCRRHKDTLGGLVVYPDKHEWKTGSDAYQYCSTKSTPTVMLPYKYLALILHFRNRFDSKNLKKLWDYDRLFPKALKDKKNNKERYWKTINNELLLVLNIKQDEFEEYLKIAESKITNYIQGQTIYFSSLKETVKAAITKEINGYDLETARKKLMEIRLETETKRYTEIIERIKKFRLN